MNTFKKLALSLFAVILILGLPFLFADGNEDIDIIPAVSATNIVQSGSCGTNVTYTLDSKGTLTISGTGAMKNYSIFSSPWYSSRASIKKVVISDGVTSIGDKAFYECSSLQSVTIPDSITSIGENTFSYCSSLQSVYIEDLTKWFAIDFKNNASNPLYCTADLYLNGEKVVDVTVPAGTTEIGTQLRGCTSLLKVTIPDSVTSIGNTAFYSCSSLQRVTIPDSVTNIGSSAFSNCSSLQSVTIPDSVTSIGDWAFSDCSSLQSVTIGDSVTNIGKYAFSYCSRLRSVTIPDGITSIGDSAFFDCSSLQSVTIPDGVTSIEYGAFRYCSSLQSVTIPDSVTSIGDVAFYKCSSLQSVYIEDLTKWFVIDFKDNTSNPLYYTADLYLNGEKVADVTIPASTTEIGTQLRGCTSLVSVTIPDSVTSIGDWAFSDCSSLQSVTISDSVTSIGENAFSYCSNLQSVTIPDGITSIGDYTFYDCSRLQSVTLPESITTIGYSAFRFCKNLTDVYYSGTKEQWSKIAIGELNNELHKAEFHLYCKHKISEEVINCYTIYKCSKCGYVEKPEFITRMEQLCFYASRINERDVDCSTYELTIDNSVAFYGDVTKHNIDGLLLIAFSAQHNYGDYAYNYSNNGFTPHAYSVPKEDIDAMFREVFGLSNIDFSISKRYDTENEIFYDSNGFGWGPVNYVTTYENEMYIVKVYDEICSEPQVFSSIPFLTVTFNNNANITGIYFPESPENAPSDDHNYIVTTTPQTCDNGGFATYSCLCGYSYIEPNHKWNNGTITTTATCTVSGVKTYICQYNSVHTKTENLGVNASEHVSTKNVYAVAPTCSAIGYTTGVYCNDCQKYISGHNEIAIDTDAHKWDNGTITTTATCKVSGVKTYTCQHDSSHQRTENLGVNASNHVDTKTTDAIAPTCSAVGYTAGTYCNDCSKYISGHKETAINFSNHVNTKNVPETPATFESVGYTAGVYCNDCKKYISGHEEIPKLVPEFTDSKDAKVSGNNIVSNNGLTVAQLLSLAGKGAVITTAKGAAVAEKDLIGTGMILTMPDGSKKEIVVYGDVDGDGKISAADARQALRASVGLENFKEDSAKYKAAKRGSVDKLSAADARLILRASVGLEDPKSWIK